jgi:hypothetical protein
MAPPKKKAKNEKNWKIENIVKHEIRPDLTCKFFIKWRNFEPKDNTWEPVENMLDIPLVAMNYQIKSRSELLKAAGDISEEAQASIGFFPPIPAPVITKMKKAAAPREYFPRGTEELAHAINRTVDASTGLMMWNVDFVGMQGGARRIREAVFAYYWPEKAILYTNHFQRKEAKFERLVEGASGSAD